MGRGGGIGCGVGRVRWIRGADLLGTATFRIYLEGDSGDGDGAVRSGLLGSDESPAGHGQGLVEEIGSLSSALQDILC